MAKKIRRRKRAGFDLKKKISDFKGLLGSKASKRSQNLRIGLSAAFFVAGLIALTLAFQNCSSSPSNLGGFNYNSSGVKAPGLQPTYTPVPTLPSGLPTATPTPIPGISPTTSPNNATCSISLNPNNNPAFYGPNTGLTATTSYSGSPAAARGCVRVFRNVNGTYQLQSTSCLSVGSPVTISTAVQAQYYVDATFADSNGFAVPCTATGITYTVSSSGGGGSSGSFVVTSVSQGSLDAGEQNFTLKVTAASQPDGVSMNCQGTNFEAHNVSSSLLSSNSYQVDFSVTANFDPAKIGVPNSCSVSAKIGSTLSVGKAFMVLPQFGSITSDGDGSTYTASGNFGNAYLVTYNCPGGPQGSYSLQNFVQSNTKTPTSFKMTLPGFEGYLCYFYVGETYPVWSENDQPFTLVMP